MNNSGNKRLCAIIDSSKTIALENRFNVRESLSECDCNLDDFNGRAGP